MTDYRHFLSTLCKKQWERIGIERRAGVAVPLFSLYSAKSIGIGELTDLSLLVEWCDVVGMSIIQLLPMNDVGFNFMPYDAQSTFALEPMYISIEGLFNVDLAPFKNEIKALRYRFPCGSRRVNYAIRKAKLELLRKIFKKGIKKPSAAFSKYIADNKFWLDDYALYKVIKENNSESSWEKWDGRLKYRDSHALEALSRNNTEAIEFHKWLQWQLYKQFKAIKQYAQSKGVFLMGDLPFLVSRDSADVWSHQDYFKLGLCSGAPPDMYFAKGQRWGMPVYNWDGISAHNYDYIREKLKYAENFYDLFRIDHVVGIFRVWSIPILEPKESAGLHGTFDPYDQHLWETQGRKILSLMATSSSMLPCAEDLGVVPECSYRVLEEFGIPGIEVQRWTKYWGSTYGFKAPHDYRKNAVATVATHDSSILCAWWEFEAGTVDGELFKRKCQEIGVSFDILQHELFDLNNSFHGRLRWRHKVNNVDTLLKMLNSSQDKAHAIIALYKESFDEKRKFWDYVGMGSKFSEKCSHDLIRLALEKINSTASIFSIQLLQDWISVDCLYECDFWNMRINFPGTISDKNWSLVADLSLEDMLTLPINSVIRSLNAKAGRK